MTTTRPSPGYRVTPFTMRTETFRSESLAPASPLSRPLRAASGGGLRPALTAAASGAAVNHRNENAIASASHSTPTTMSKACPDQSFPLTTTSPYKPGLRCRDWARIWPLARSSVRFGMANRMFKTGVSRDQVSLLPARVEDYVGGDNPVRAIEAFVATLDLERLGFGHAGSGG